MPTVADPRNWPRAAVRRQTSGRRDGGKAVVTTLRRVNSVSAH